MNPQHPHDHNAAEHPTCEGRREALKRGACACLGMGLAAGAMEPAQAQAQVQEGANQRPNKGDRLVIAGADGVPRPLTVADLKPGGKPVQAFPFDPVNKQIRDGSRLNKILLVRLDPANIDPATKARAAEGVMAYSAVCTHQGCDVTEWVDAEKALMCFCHFSRFDPARGGQVVAGPAPRDLPSLPLTVDRGQLTVAGSFSSQPGAKASA